jgi:excisionase family DNA binding protein
LTDGQFHDAPRIDERDGSGAACSGSMSMPQQGRGRELSRTLTASEAAALIGVSVATVRGWADHGVLPSHRTVGGHRRFESAELRAWLRARGATMPAPVAGVARKSKDVPPCPALARHLNGRTRAIVDRVVDGYRDDVPTLSTRPTDAAMRRQATRSLRIVTAALETGSVTKSVARAELAGFSDGTHHDGSAASLVQLTRLFMAIACEAQTAVDDGTVDDPRALPALLAVIEHVVVADAAGLQQGSSTPVAGSAEPAAARPRTR